ncbi:hypothetical protein FH972_026718 [Carpinus fangiana]|uniref:Transcription factor Iwr1 domain-containing protein n=1 Tax=Carpinus fangiana TaxID=176857 RepID=A0A5N6L7B9_9ROSI|nr:hypothetical protein FH972_026718 [Carpinus fangiana]
MSLPPAVLRIKRKRGDEPVDALCALQLDDSLPPPDEKLISNLADVQNASSASKRLMTEPNYVFRRHDVTTAPAAFHQEQQAAPSDKPEPMVEDCTQHGLTSHVISSPRSSSRKTPSLTVSQRSSPSNPTSHPRRFHLSKPSTLKSQEILTGSVRNHRSRRHPAATGTNVAVLVETRPRVPEVHAAPPLSAGPDAPNTPLETEQHLSQPTVATTTSLTDPPAQKRPSAKHIALDSTATAAETRRVGSSTMDTLPHGPAPTFNPEHGNIGYLVIDDSDEALWQTYASDLVPEEEEDDWDSEQDDENAENYYGADYPEEEVNSGEERVYRFRDEEYDLADASSSDGGVDDEVELWETYPRHAWKERTTSVHRGAARKAALTQQHVDAVAEDVAGLVQQLPARVHEQVAQRHQQPDAAVAARHELELVGAADPAHAPQEQAHVADLAQPVDVRVLLRRRQRGPVERVAEAEDDQRCVEQHPRPVQQVALLGHEDLAQEVQRVQRGLAGARRRGPDLLDAALGGGAVLRRDLAAELQGGAGEDLGVDDVDVERHVREVVHDGARLEDIALVLGCGGAQRRD